jgi:ribosomal protein S1
VGTLGGISLIMSNKMQVGDIVDCTVTGITTFGAFVETDEEVICLLHLHDISWSRNIKHPATVLHVGDRIRCKVTVIDIQNCRIQVSLKAMQQDPWDVLGANYPIGKTLAAPIMRLLDRGVIVQTTDGLECFVPLSKLPVRNIRVPADAFCVGQLLTGRIISKERETRKIIVSCLPVAEEYRRDSACMSISA